MNTSFEIAKRYLFGKKSTNAINLITGISVLGMSIGTAALILILSVFNGFESLLSGLLNDFNPDLKVSPIDGKYFETSDEDLKKLKEIDGVQTISKTVEEIAFYEYDNVQEVGVIKGVDELFSTVTRIDSTIRKGSFVLKEDNISYGVLGMGLANKLGVNFSDAITPIKVYMPLRKKKGPLAKDFKYKMIYPSGAFSVQSDNDFSHLICSYEFASKLLETKNKVSALEFKIDPSKEKEIIDSVLGIMGEGFETKNRYQQDEAFLKIMNIEKWVSYLIACLTLFIIAFNLIGALWMIVLEKREDISILRALGYTSKGIRNLFVIEGVLICGLGLFMGIVLALLLYVLQKYFGLISIPEGFIIDAYPIEIKWKDFLVVSITVLLLGFFASMLPARRAAQVTPFVRQEI